MNCHDMRAVLDEYDARSLDGKTHQTVSEHLLKCRECQNELEALREVSRALDQWEAPPIPSGLVRRTCVALEELADMEPVRPARFQAYRRFLLPAAVAAVIAVIGCLAYLNVQMSSNGSGEVAFPAGLQTRVEPEPLTLWADFNDQVLSKVKNPNARMLMNNAFEDIVGEAEKENVEKDGKPQL